MSRDARGATVAARETVEWVVVKLRPDGSEAARYRATGVDAPEGWVAARAVWTFGTVDIGYFTFEPGDVLYEYFSIDRPYNLFATYRPDRGLVGWYCNVTHPTRVVDGVITWHDLWVDVLVLTDGSIVVVDLDELEESGVAASDPALYRTILDARDELVAMAERRAWPFSAADNDGGGDG